ncbi:MAG TPA: hypothetical protein ENN21_03335 [Spirochaetes bacterium]|nr:hypothetical protein [Spirochaetota bacterium]
MKLSIKLVELNSEYIANCPELDVNCYGVDRDEAIRRLKSVLRFYIESAHELGLEVERFEGFYINGEPQEEEASCCLPAVRSIN